MVNHIDTEPSIIPRVVDIPASVFTAQNQSINLSSDPAIGILIAGMRILDVAVIKEIPFDANTVEIGYGSVAAQRATIATAAEVNATAAGVAKPMAWAEADGVANRLLTTNTSLFARTGAGAVPEVGLLRLVLLTYYPSPRSVL